MKKLFLYVFLVFFSVLNNGWTADFEKGLEAFENEKYKKAYKEWKPLAEQGHEEAQLGLGHLYNRGKGVSQSDDEAIKWYLLAADQGNAIAQHRLGSHYLGLFKEFKNYELALKWFQLSADQGYSKAQASLAYMYKEGLGVSQNIDEALKWYHLAAEQGDHLSQIKLYFLYEEGEIIPQDLEQAKKWYELLHKKEYDYEAVQLEYKELEKKVKHDKLWREALNAPDGGTGYISFQKFKDLADDGHREAQYMVGMMYRGSTGVEFDSDQIEKYWKLAAEQGHEKAKQSLSAYYESATYKNKKPTGEIFLSGYIILGIFLFGIAWLVIVFFREYLKKKKE